MFTIPVIFRSSWPLTAISCSGLHVLVLWVCLMKSLPPIPHQIHACCSVYNLPSLLLMTDWNYNGVIRVQTYKNGVRQPLRIWSRTSLHHWEPDISLTCPRSKDRSSPIQSNTCQLHSCSLKVTPFNCAAILDPGLSILNRNPYLPDPIILF